MLNLVSESSYWAIFLIAFSAAVDKVGKTRAGLRGLGVTRFGLDIAVQIYDVDDEEEMMENIKTAMRLVEQTYLGGYGSRGSGKVAFENMTLDGQPFKLY
jgi:CRISPR/Cas system CSM-associated protein Csm3 (group 7 of RAMP superfamily)